MLGAGLSAKGACKELKKTTVLVILIAVLLSLAAAANAQYGPPAFDTEEPPWYIRAGAAFPLGDTPDDVVPVVGLGYEEGFSDNPGSFWGFSADYIPMKTETVTLGIGPGGELIVEDVDSHTASLVPFLVYVKGQSVVGGYRMWGAAGIGTYWASRDVPEMQLDSGFNFAWSLQAGLDFSRQLFADVRYIAGSNPGDDGIITTELGWRF